MTEKEYIGNGVYVRIDECQGVWLTTTEDGITVTNAIYLEPEVWRALMEFHKRSKAPKAPAGKITRGY